MDEGVIPFGVKKKCEYCGHGWIALVVERSIVYTKCPNCGRGRFLWSYLDRDYEKLRERSIESINWRGRLGEEHVVLCLSGINSAWISVQSADSGHADNPFHSTR